MVPPIASDGKPKRSIRVSVYALSLAELRGRNTSASRPQTQATAVLALQNS
jgi:hypothetical protein